MKYVILTIRKKRALFLGLFFLIASDHGPLFAATASSVSQYGITWTFDKEYEVGQFTNGDWWVVGPIVITRITPDFDGSYNGWEANPSSIVDQGFDTRAYNYKSSLVPTLPYTANPVTSIVKVVSNMAAGAKCSCNPYHTCYLSTAAVLTVLAAVPADNGQTVFRPPYFGNQKMMFSTKDMHLELLPALSPVANTPTLTDIQARFARVQLDHQRDWIGRAIHPDLNMPDYGASLALNTHDAALRFMLNDPAADKVPALVNYVQYGIDLYGMLLGGDSWPANGGHGLGRKLPLIFAAWIFENDAMKSAVMNAPNGTFHEDGQIFFSPTADNGKGQVLWGQVIPEGNYWNEFVHYDSGSKVGRDPYGFIDGGWRPGATYDFCCNLKPWKGSALAQTIVPELKRIWHNDHFADFVYRRVNDGIWTEADPCAPITGVCAGGTNVGAPCTSATEIYDNSGNVINPACSGGGSCDYASRWSTDYKVLYGPDGKGGCIQDTDPSDGIGRLPAMNGAQKDAGYYSSAFIESLWGAYQNYRATVLFGDVNNDHETTAYDAALVAQASVNLISLTADQSKAADVSGDSEVTAYDAALIAQRAVGLIDKFPVEG